jgi:methylphosphotriester-DNA--protein-cysteine methyltransferase
MSKLYKLLGSDGRIYESATLGELGGNSKAKIYGKLDCPAANAALKKGYARHRVFFLNENEAVAAGYRPCGRCMRKQYLAWKERQ